MNKTILCIAIIMISLVGSILFLINYKQLKTKSIYFQNKNEKLELENEIQLYTIKKLLKTNINRDSTYKICLMLKSSACSSCNESIVRIVKYKFSKHDICFLIDKKDSLLINYLNLKDYIILNGSLLKEFDSNGPTFFILKDSTFLYEFTPDSNYPKLTEMYLTFIGKIIGEKRH